MKKINDFVNKVYANFDGDKRELKELKTDMRAHLIETVEELKAEGKSENEAIAIAIDRFGEENQVTSEMMEIYRLKNKPLKYLFRTAMLFLLVGVVLGIALNVRDHLIEKDTRLFKYETHRVVERALKDSSLSPNDKEEIVKNFKKLAKGRKVYMSIYDKSTGKNTDEMKSVFIYGSKDYFGLGGGSEWENKNYYVDFKYQELSNYKNLYFVPYILYFVFFILFITFIILKILSKRENVRSIK